MSPWYPLLSSVIGFVYLLALSFGAILAVSRLRHLGSWLLLAGTLMQWLSFAVYFLTRHVVYFPFFDSEYRILFQIGIGGLGRLTMVAGFILLLLYARALQIRARSLEQFTGAVPALPPGR